MELEKKEKDLSVREQNAVALSAAAEREKLLVNAREQNVIALSAATEREKLLVVAKIEAMVLSKEELSVEQGILEEEKEEMERDKARMTVRENSLLEDRDEYDQNMEELVRGQDELEVEKEQLKLDQVLLVEEKIAVQTGVSQAVRGVRCPSCKEDTVCFPGSLHMEGDCAVCMETVAIKHGHQTACGHWFCNGCTEELVRRRRVYGPAGHDVYA